MFLNNSTDDLLCHLPMPGISSTITKSLDSTIRVRRDFRFEAKRSKTKAKLFSLQSEKKVSFASFHFEVKRKKEKRNGNETVREVKRNKTKEAKQSQAKLKRSERKQKESEM